MTVPLAGVQTRDARHHHDELRCQIPIAVAVIRVIPPPSPPLPPPPSQCSHGIQVWKKEINSREYEAGPVVVQEVNTGTMFGPKYNSCKKRGFDAFWILRTNVGMVSLLGHISPLKPPSKQALCMCDEIWEPFLSSAC